MKKLLLACGLLVLLCGGAGAAEQPASVRCDGFAFALEQPALVRNSTAFVPLRAFCREIGVSWVEWDAAARIAHVRNWTSEISFADGQEGACLLGGKLYVPARSLAQAFGMDCDWEAASKTVLFAFPRRTVQVSDARELLAAVAPHTTIELAPGEYDFSALRPEDVDNVFARVEEIDIFETPQYEAVICGVPGLTIRGTGCTLVTDYTYADVLKYERCDRLTVSGFTAGHRAEKGSCLGDVLEFNDCAYVLAEDCDLYGCGAYGIVAGATVHLTVRDTTIRDCSYGAVSLWEYGGDILFQNCRITGNEKFNVFQVWKTAGSVLVENCEITGNRCQNLAYNNSETSVLTLRGCTLSDNVFEQEPETLMPGGIVIE